jgi:hypothetical protein
MAIATRDALLAAFGHRRSRLYLNKGQLSNATSGNANSYFRLGNTPAAGAIPGAAAVCNSVLTGAIPFPNQTAPATSYLAAGLLATNLTAHIEIHDRLMHMGGMSGTVTTAQTANVDLHANLGTANLAARIGKSDYSEVNWWLEWYTDTGATGVNATVNVTYNDGTDGDLTVIAIATTSRAGRMYALNTLVPAAKAGFYIRDVNSVLLSATTGTAGSFGVTATRLRATLQQQNSLWRSPADWAELGFPQIHNDSCLFPIAYYTSGGTGPTWNATLDMVHG